MDDNNIRSFVTADRNIPDEQTPTPSEDTRTILIRERVKHAGDVNKLYILGIISLITSVLTNEALSDFFGILSTIASLASFVCTIMLLVTYFQMGETIKEYKISAYCAIASVVIAIISAIIGVISVFTVGIAGLVFTIILLIATLVVSIYGAYKEFMGHVELVSGIDNELSEKWNTLWGWMLFSLIAVFIGGFLGEIIPGLGVIIVLIAGIISIVVSVIEVVYLKKMSDLFKDIEQEYQSWNNPQI